MVRPGLLDGCHCVSGLEYGENEIEATVGDPIIGELGSESETF